MSQTKKIFGIVNNSDENELIGTICTSGQRGPQGPSGDCHFATFEINPLDGMLYVNYSPDKKDITFSLSNGYLEVSIA